MIEMVEDDDFRRIEQERIYPREAERPEPLVAVRLSEVEPESVGFLSEPRIPMGKLTIAGGDPDAGKTTIALDCAARLSRGEPLFGLGPRTVPGEALIFTAEDGIADTIRPRLDKLNADCSKIHAVSTPIRLDSSLDLDRIDELVGRLAVDLAVLDPIAAFLGGGVDMHRQNEVRAVLRPLADIAERHHAAVIGIHHLSKGRSGRAQHSMLGSVDFSAAARSVLLAGSAGDDPDDRALIHVKCNLAPKASALGYRLVGGGIEWTGTSSLTASDLIGAESSGDERAEIEDAMGFLSSILADGPVDAVEVLRRAGAAGLSEKTCRRAKRRLDIRSVKSGFSGGWAWALPA